MAAERIQALVLSACKARSRVPGSPWVRRRQPELERAPERAPWNVVPKRATIGAGVRRLDAVVTEGNGAAPGAAAANAEVPGAAAASTVGLGGLRVPIRGIADPETSALAGEGGATSHWLPCPSDRAAFPSAIPPPKARRRRRRRRGWSFF